MHVRLRKALHAHCLGDTGVTISFMMSPHCLTDIHFRCTLYFSFLNERKVFNVEMLFYDDPLGGRTQVTGFVYQSSPPSSLASTFCIYSLWYLIWLHFFLFCTIWFSLLLFPLQLRCTFVLYVEPVCENINQEAKIKQMHRQTDYLPGVQ